MTEYVNEAIRKAFLKTFPQNEFLYSLMRKELKVWDSINHVKFLYEIELQLGIRFTGEEAASIFSIEDLQKIINGKNDNKV